jgi:hypothetical protein
MGTVSWGLGWLATGVASEELYFPGNDVIEGGATVVDVVVAACDAMKLRLVSLSGHCECGTDRCRGVVFGDDEQGWDRDVVGAADWAGMLSSDRAAIRLCQSTSSRGVMTFLPNSASDVSGDAPFSGRHVDRQIDGRAAE